MAQGFLQVVMSTKIIAVLSQGSELFDPNKLMDEVISEVRLSHSKHIYQVVSILDLLKKSYNDVKDCSVESVDSNCNIIMTMIKDIYDES